MKYLLHGDDMSSSRNFLSELTYGFVTTVLDGKTLTQPVFEVNLASQTLFGEKKAIVIENLLSKNSKKKDFMEFVNTQNESVLLIFWEEKKIPKTAFSSMKNITVREFFLPQNYFQFLDTFVPGNPKKVYTLYHELLSSMDDSQILYSLIKRLRYLMIISKGAVTSELSKMSDWQLSKLKNQARHWKNDKLTMFYKELVDAQISLQSGKLPVGLSKHLDILILSKLE